MTVSTKEGSQALTRTQFLGSLTPQPMNEGASIIEEDLSIRDDIQKLLTRIWKHRRAIEKFNAAQKKSNSQMRFLVRPAQVEALELMLDNQVGVPVPIVRE